MSDRRGMMKNSGGKGGSTSNFSLKCLRIVEKCIGELKRVLQGIDSQSSASGGVLKHQTALIQACGKNLLTALTSCNIYRIPFAEEAYYMTQLTKIERSVSQIFDGVASLECRKFACSLGNNKQAEDLFSMLETTFDSFVGPLLHIFNSFNVRCLLFQCDPLNLYLLDQLDGAAIRKKLCLFTLTGSSNVSSQQQSQQIQALQPEEYEDSCSDAEDLQSTNESATFALERSNENDSGSNAKKPMKFNELLQYYLKREEQLLSEQAGSGECVGGLAELAILIDYLSEEDASRYESTFYSFYFSLFEESVSEKITTILRHTRSFRALNHHIKAMFYDSEIMSLPVEEIQLLLSDAATFTYSDLKLTLIRSSYDPEEAQAAAVAAAASSGLPLQLPMLDSVMVSREATEQSQSRTSTMSPWSGGFAAGGAAHSQFPFVSFCGSSSLSEGEVMAFCPHTHSLLADTPAKLNAASCNCKFLKEQAAIKVIKSDEFPEAEIDSNERTLCKKSMVFGRRAQNAISKVDFGFSEHETLISRQQFQITYEPFSNEYNVQCLSQASLTQLVIDDAGFELSEGAIFVVQDMIAFQVVSLKSFSGRHRQETKLLHANDSTGVTQDKSGSTPSITEIAHKLNRQFADKSGSSSSSSLSSSSNALQKLKRNSRAKMLSDPMEEDSVEESDSQQSASQTSTTTGENDDRKYQKLFRKSSASNKISYRGSAMLNDGSANAISSAVAIAAANNNNKSNEIGCNSGSEGGSEDGDNSSNQNSGDESGSEENSDTIEAKPSNQKRERASLDYIASIAEQPGSLLKVNRKSLSGTQLISANGGHRLSRSSVVESKTELAVPAEESENQIADMGTSIAPEDECTMDYKKAVQNDEEVGMGSGGDVTSLNMIQSQLQNQQQQQQQTSNQMSTSILGSMTGSVNNNFSSQKSMQTLNHSRSLLQSMQSIYDLDEDNPKEEAYLQLRVLWSKVQTEKEDYLFQYDPKNDVALKRGNTNDSGSKSEEEEEDDDDAGNIGAISSFGMPSQEESSQQQLLIHIGSDSKKNQIHVNDTSNSVLPFAHCTISYSDNAWTIFSSEASNKAYAGMALKKADEIEHGLISKKILIEKGYRILVSGYIFECDI